MKELKERKEKREIEQRKIYENGKLKYVIIPNYTKSEFFMSSNEIRFYKFLINVIIEIKEQYGENYDIFPQVAINRIIKQNNRREKELEKELFAKSIDFVIYDRKTENIVCCIELDGIEHQIDKKRQERDIVINDMFESAAIKLIRQPVQEMYNTDIMIKKIMK